MTAVARQLALVTGASSGIGFELARQFAEHEFDLVVCAEDEGIEDAAKRLAETGASVETVQEDLRSADAVERLYAAATASGRPLAAAALNAGVGQGGAFVDTPLAELLEIVDLNVRSTVHLARLVLADMVARNAGRVLITSSIASTMPGSYQAVYNASKSFDQSLATALQDELTDTGIVVTSLMPGPTDTNFFTRAGMAVNTRVGRGRKDDPADVARQGYEALMAGRKRAVAASVGTKLQEAATTVLPDRLKAIMHRLMAKPDRGE